MRISRSVRRKFLRNFQAFRQGKMSRFGYVYMQGLINNGGLEGD